MLLDDEDFTTQDANDGEGQPSDTAPWQMAKEQLQQWKRNRRALVYLAVFPFNFCLCFPF